MRRKSRYQLCMLLSVVTLPAVLVGHASLASNHVAPSSMGMSKFSVSVPTSLAAEPDAKVNVSQAASKGYLQFEDVKADLASAGSPLAGEAVTFTADGVTLCMDTTNHDGQASCTGHTRVDVSEFKSVPTTFTAVFSGDGGLQGSNDTGGLALVG